MSKQNRLLGWREWVHLPDLGLPLMKAKVDTGARTSCLHAFALDTFSRAGTDWVRFSVHPTQQNIENVVECEAPIVDRRPVRDSGGHSEERIVIKTHILIGDWKDEIEMTLTSRDDMRFRILLGRTAIVAGNFTINPALSYTQGEHNKQIGTSL